MDALDDAAALLAAAWFGAAQGLPTDLSTLGRSSGPQRAALALGVARIAGGVARHLVIVDNVPLEPSAADRAGDLVAVRLVEYARLGDIDAAAELAVAFCAAEDVESFSELIANLVGIALSFCAMHAVDVGVRLDEYLDRAAEMAA